ncbi:MAG: RNA methyltransferase [Flavobacteriia bacterium]|nr:RNA methyltransferase [Flavobacteriia bacterium]
MISKNESKRIQQLQLKKFRTKENAFIAETPKVVEEFLKAGFIIKNWFATEDYSVPSGIQAQPTVVATRDLKTISQLQTPHGTVAVFSIPKEIEKKKGRFVLALDGVRDPGNMGTIIRLADWFNVDDVLLSEDCVDIWNAKVVQSSMGSLARVVPQNVNLVDELNSLKAQGYRVAVADMDGEDYSGFDWKSPTVLVMGNEGVGPRPEIQEIANSVVTIPRLRNDGAESLNVAMATGILLAGVMRS